MDYGSIVRRALEIAWHHRWLWLLALLAGETGASGSFGSRVPAPTGGGGRPPASTPPPSGATLQPALSWIGLHAGLIVLVFVLLAAAFLVLLVISAIAEGAAVRGAAALDSGQAAGLGASWRLGLEVFWPMLGLRVLVFLVGFGVVIVMAALIASALAAGFALHSPGLAALLGWQWFGLLAVLLPVAVAAGAIVKLGARSVALAGAGPWTGLVEATRLVWRRLGPVAVLWVIELVCSIGVAIVFVFASLSLFLPVVGGAIAAVGGRAPAALVPLALYALLGLALLVVAGAAVSAFFSVYWTVGYRRLAALG